MANPVNVFDFTNEDLATFLAKSVSDGTYNNVFGTLKVDQTGEDAAATQIIEKIGQLWGNALDDFVLSGYPKIRNVALGNGGLLHTTGAAKTGAYTALPGELVRYDATGGTFTVEVPASPADNTRFGIVEIGDDGTQITIDAGSDTVIGPGGTSGTTLLLGSELTALIWEFSSDDSTWSLVSEAGAVGGGGAVTHASTTGQTTDDHHAQVHTIVSHDTTATGAQLNTLVGAGNADALHAHAHSATTGQGVDDHHAQLHAAAHSDGGGDEITVEDLATDATDTAFVLKPDGSGGVEFGAAPAPPASTTAVATGFTAYGTTNTRIVRMPNRTDAGDITWDDDVADGMSATSADGGTYAISMMLDNPFIPDTYATNTAASLSNTFDASHIRATTTAAVGSMGWTEEVVAGGKIWLSAAGSQDLSSSTTLNRFAITKISD